MPDPDQSVASAKAFLARWVYEQLAMLRDQTLGPALRMPEYCFGAYDVLLPALEEIVGPKRKEEAGKVLTVPTPWHAALILDSLQDNLHRTGRRALFRGQSDSSWGITSSISRPGVDIPTETFKAKLFIDILRNMSFNNMTTLSPTFKAMTLTIPESSYLAAAQHYGIRTHLIDFTPDPSVAVFFAAGSETPKPGTMASVYVLALETIIERGGHIIIPPPFIERLHIQRGVFIDQSQSRDPIDKDSGIVFELRFPADFEFRPFRVVRRDAGIVDVLPPDQDIDRVISSIKKVIAAERIHDLSDQDYRRIVEMESAKTKRTLNRSQSFSGFYHDPMMMWGEYVDAFEDMLFWTAYYADKQERLGIDKEMLSHIVRYNRSLIDSVVQIYQWMMGDPTFNCDERRKDFLSQLIEIMKSSHHGERIAEQGAPQDGNSATLHCRR